MSRPSWDALADRYGAQSAEYSVTPLDCDCLSCGREYGQRPCDDCIALERDGLPDDALMTFAPYPATDYLGIARAHQDAGAAADGQATVALALGVWLALLAACALVTAAAFGAAWIDGAWLAPFVWLR